MLDHLNAGKCFEKPSAASTLSWNARPLRRVESHELHSKNRQQFHALQLKSNNHRTHCQPKDPLLLGKEDLFHNYSQSKVLDFVLRAISYGGVDWVHLSVDNKEAKVTAKKKQPA